jgi:hypothetical protein
VVLQHPGTPEEGTMELRKHQEMVDQAIARLAQKARDLGVRLVRNNDGRHYASSISRPGHWHYVTGVSCDCQGFATHQRCMHHSALMSALGWDGSTPEPENIEEPACHRCHDTGTVRHHHSRWIGPSKLGYRSEWDSLEPCPDCTPAAA